MGAKAQLASIGYERKREIGRKVMRAYNASLTPLQIKKRREQSIKNLQALTLEQRKKNAKKARQNANLKPNSIEGYIITILREFNIYAEYTKTAQAGKVYYADIKENRMWIRLKNGTYTIPDFKVKSQRKIIEVWGRYWHSKKFCEARDAPSYKWDAQKMINEYAAIGYKCLILHEFEIKQVVLRNYIKKTIWEFVTEEPYADDN